MGPLLGGSNDAEAEVQDLDALVLAADKAVLPLVECPEAETECLGMEWVGGWGGGWGVVGGVWWVGCGGGVGWWGGVGVGVAVHYRGWGR